MIYSPKMTIETMSNPIEPQANFTYYVRKAIVNHLSLLGATRTINLYYILYNALLLTSYKLYPPKTSWTPPMARLRCATPTFWMEWLCWRGAWALHPSSCRVSKMWGAAHRWPLMVIFWLPEPLKNTLVDCYRGLHYLVYWGLWSPIVGTPINQLVKWDGIGDSEPIMNGFHIITLSTNQFLMVCFMAQLLGRVILRWFTVVFKHFEWAGLGCFNNKQVAIWPWKW